MKHFKSIIISLSLVLGAPALADRTDGGHDGGGANLWTSSPAQVREAIDWAIAELREDKAIPSGAQTWLFWATAYSPEATNRHGEKVLVTQCLNMPMTCDTKQFLEDLDENRPVYMKAWDYLKLSHLTILENGPCPARDKAHAAGSVSAFKVGADLCLSVSELSRTPPGGLRAQVTSVLAHEMAHLLGFDEEIAAAVQKSIVENFGEISRADGSMLVYQVAGAMTSVQSALFNARSFSNEGAMGIGYYLLGYAGGTLNTLVDMLPDGYNDRTIPVAEPALYPQVKQSLKSLEGKLLAVAWKPNLSKEAFDASLDQLEDDYAASAQLLERFLGREVIRFPRK